MSTREVIEKRYGSDPAYEEPGLTARELRDWSGDRLPTFVTSDLARDLIAAQARIAELEGALAKISSIRDGIIGAQRVNWSEHVYPLVAALDAAGYEGIGYDAARANLLTLLEQLAAAEARIAKVKALPAKWVVDGDGDGDVCRCANELKAALEAP